jgi:hypothetical protein
LGDYYRQWEFHYGSTDIEDKTCYFRFNVGHFVLLILNFNFQVVRGEDHRVTRADCGFPKELLWYFGTDKLVIEEDDTEEEDWGYDSTEGGYGDAEDEESVNGENENEQIEEVEGDGKGEEAISDS